MVQWELREEEAGGDDNKSSWLMELLDEVSSRAISAE